MLDKATAIKNRIRTAKDITVVYKNLEKEGFNVETYSTKIFEENYFKTDITNKEVDVNVIWRPYTEPSTSNGYKQEIMIITY